jgi:lysophospholipase L1-like esterase
MCINHLMLTGLCGLAIGIMAVSAVAVEPAETVKKPVKVACVGDSLTSGFKMVKPEINAYPAQLGKLLGDGYEVKGFAEPGRTALQKAERPLWKEKVFADAVAWNPDMVVICLGTNDSWPAIWAKLGGEFDGDLRAMIDTFAKLPSHPKIYLCVPTPLYLDTIPDQQKIMLEEVNPTIRKVAKETGCKLIDFYTPLFGKADLFQDDKVHPLPTAGAAMAQIVADAIVWLPLKESDVVVCLGDSITDGNTYPQIIMQSMKEAGKPATPFVCSGIGGNTIPQMAARFNRDVAVLKPTVITVNAGTNDSLHFESPEIFEKALRELVAKAKAINAKLILSTPCPINPQPNADEKIAIQNREKAKAAETLGAKYAEIIRKIAAEEGYPVAETFAIMDKARNDGKEIMTGDGIHPNYFGQTLIARSILDVIKCYPVAIPKEFKPQMYPGVVKEWQMRIAPKPIFLDAITVTAVQPDATWKSYKLPDPEPVKPTTPEDWMEQTRQSGFGLQLNKVIGKGKIQAFATIDCQMEKQAYINTGIGVESVWLNGKKIYTPSPDWSGFHAGKERIQVQLNKGANTLIIEINGSQFFLSVTDELVWERELIKN